MSDTVLTAAKVSRRFQRGDAVVEALLDVGVEVRRDEFTVLAGPSGSGKTTLLSLLGGYEEPDSGTVRAHRPLPTDMALAELPWSHMAYIPQAVTLLEELTVAENIAMPARLAGGGRADEATLARGRELSERLEIAHLASRFPSQISGGEQQRTAVARALCVRPTVVLADEPTGSQDRARVAEVLSVLTEHAHLGHAVVCTSHDDDVIAAADTVVNLFDGRTVVGV